MSERTLPPPPGLRVESLDHAETGELVLSFPIGENGAIHAELTRAEREIVEGVLTGLTNVEIAERRGVSPFTVGNQVAMIFAKLSVHSRLDLALALRRAA